MKVWLVWGVLEHEGQDLLKIFDDPKKAKDFYESCKEYDNYLNCSFDRYTNSWQEAIDEHPNQRYTQYTWYECKESEVH